MTRLTRASTGKTNGVNGSIQYGKAYVASLHDGNDDADADGHPNDAGDVKEEEIELW